jgi:hypothetical protein
MSTSAYRPPIPVGQAESGELNIFLDSRTCQVMGSYTASLPLDPPLDGGRLRPEARFSVSALRPGGAKIRAELYIGTDFRHTLEGEVWVAGADGRDRSVAVRPRPVPQPDLVLHAGTRWTEDGSATVLHYHVDSYGATALPTNGIKYQSESFSTGWLERAHGVLALTIDGIASGTGQDARRRLTSFGRYLYQTAFPPTLQADLYKWAGTGRTMLVVADQGAALPWELLHDGRGFLGEHFIIGRWPRELADARPYEFPIGHVSMVYYAEIEQPDKWADLLRPPNMPQLQPEILVGGVLDLQLAGTLGGLHIIRRGQTPGAADRMDAPIRADNLPGSTAIEAEVRTAKLSLRLNRPLVTLGYLSAGKPEMTLLEDIWVPTYIRAGCSAFVGPAWAVEPAIEAAFISGFYAALWAGARLGDAFRAAQNLARSAVPDSLDWLAYVLYGDPMARAYRPVKGEGYAVVEPVGRQPEDPVPPGSEARFRVRLRRTPPVWHANRVIEVAEQLVFDRLQVHVVAPDLRMVEGSPIDMRLTPDRDYQGWFTLLVPQAIVGSSALVQVYFADGDRLVHSVMFSLRVAGREDEQK